MTDWFVFILCTSTYFDFILCTVAYRYLLQLEVHLRLICVIKFTYYPLTYLLTYFISPPSVALQVGWNS